MWTDLAEEMASWSPDPADKWQKELTEDPDTPPAVANGDALKQLSRRSDKGTVVLDVVIDPFGVVRHKEVRESEAGYQFTLDVLNAIDHCQLTPARKGEECVWVRTILPVTFDPHRPSGHQSEA